MQNFIILHQKLRFFVLQLIMLFLNIKYKSVKIFNKNSGPEVQDFMCFTLANSIRPPTGLTTGLTWPDHSLFHPSYLSLTPAVTAPPIVHLTPHLTPYYSSGYLLVYLP